MMKIRIPVVLLQIGRSLCLGLASSYASAQQDVPRSLPESIRDYTRYVAIPIFGQVIIHGLPKGFAPVHSGQTPDGSFTALYARDGERPEDLTGYIALQGFKDLAQRPNATPVAFLNLVAGNIQRLCGPKTVSGSLGESHIDGHLAHTAFVGCGSWPQDLGGSRRLGEGEIGVFVAIRGKSDFYMFSRVLRTKAFDVGSPPINLENAKSLVSEVQPIKLCDAGTPTTPDSECHRRPQR
jgi:hypothetical protein